MTVARFWRKQDQRYNLLGTECDVCRGKFFPNKSMCPKCHRKSMGKMRPYRFSGYGIVESYTVVHAGMPQYKGQVPYVLAYIALDEGDHILAQIVDDDPGEIEIGDRVEMVFRSLGEEGRSGIIYYGYKFTRIPRK